MTDTVHKKLDPDDRLKPFITEEPKEGDTRVVIKRFPKGHLFTFDKHERSYRLSCAVLMEITQVYTQYDGWKIKSYGTKTTIPVLGIWGRIKAWFVKPNPLPVAKVIKDDKT